MAAHPIRVVVTDDLARSRLTVFFRLLLAIPHLVWFGLWTIGAVVVGVINWAATLIAGQSPPVLHDFLARYIRYSLHLHAYLSLAANPYPPFSGRPGRYPVDVEIDPPQPQNRWHTGFRILLAIPALLVAGAFVRFGATYGSRSNNRSEDFAVVTGVIPTVAFLAWFACLARARMPQGFRDLVTYGLRYVAQAGGYVLVVTDRYPNADPGELPEGHQGPEHPIRLGVADDGRRSRLTVFFRLLLALPHLVWFGLWSVAALFAAVAGWFAALATGRLPDALHRFLSAYVRYGLHLGAFVYLIGNPFPGFTGRAGSYPVDPELPARERQNRWITGFRLLLAVPAAGVAGALGGLLLAAAVLGWFASLAIGRMPGSLEQMGAFALRYNAQLGGYWLLLTERYPYSGPWLAAGAGR